MISWLKFVQNPEALAVYNDPPSLQRVELLECKYRQDFSVLELNLATDALPDRRSSKWPAAMNRLAITLQFSVTSSALQHKPGEGMPRMVTCLFTGDRGRFQFVCSGAHLQLQADCEAAWVKHLAGYVRAPFGQEQSYA